MEEPELDALLERLAAVVVELMPVDEASLLLWDAELETFSVSASTLADQSPKYVLTTVRTSGGASRWIVDHCQPLAVPDLERDPFGASDMLRSSGLRSYLGVPMVFDHRPVGVLYALHREIREFPKIDIDFMTILARRAASAIGFARLLATTRELAAIDDLTGVLNRREFTTRGERELRRAARSGRPLTAIVFDIDHFKSINDRHGHVVGDAVLREVGRRTSAASRSIDVLGRVGGEEFALLVVDLDEHGALAVGDRLRRSVADAPIEIDDDAIHISVTVGVAAHRAGEPLAALIDRADRAMYAGKAAGRDRVVMASRLDPPAVDG